MRRAGEYAIAAGVAVGLHLAGFAALGSSAPSGFESAGDGGDALVSLTPSDAGVAALVEAWETPPEVAAPELPALEAPEVEAAPALPALVAEPVPPPPDLPALPVDEALPDLAALAPPAKPEPVAPPEPQPEPQSEVAKAPEPAPEPVKPKAQPSDAQAGQAAAGQGAKGAAGTDGAAQVATAAGAAAENLRAGWGAEIRARIERRKSYPRDGDGAAGTVKLRIVVGTDGRLRGVAVAASSGSAALDAAAVKAVQRAGKFPRAPKGLGQEEVSFTLPVSFKP